MEYFIFDKRYAQFINLKYYHNSFEISQISNELEMKFKSVITKKSKDLNHDSVNKTCVNTLLAHHQYKEIKEIKNVMKSVCSKVVLL